MTLRVDWNEAVVRAFVRLSQPECSCERVEGDDHAPTCAIFTADMRWVTGAAVALESGAGEAAVALNLKALAAQGLAEKAKVPEVDYQLGYRAGDELVLIVRSGRGVPAAPMWDSSKKAGERLGTAGATAKSVLDLSVPCVCGGATFDKCVTCGHERRLLVKARAMRDLPLYEGPPTPADALAGAREEIEATVQAAKLEIIGAVEGDAALDAALMRAQVDLPSGRATE